jgi:NhaP-type Na+/H+ or K+/H+ antiporter
MGNEKILKMMKFDDSTFFFICLPPIVFASGFNMRRSNFFENISTILVFGIMGTFVAFSFFTIMTINLKNFG